MLLMLARFNQSLLLITYLAKIVHALIESSLFLVEEIQTYDSDRLSAHQEETSLT
jgi:hypothetical protein